MWVTGRSGAWIRLFFASGGPSGYVASSLPVPSPTQRAQGRGDVSTARGNVQDLSGDQVSIRRDIGTPRGTAVSLACSPSGPGTTSPPPPAELGDSPEGVSTALKSMGAPVLLQPGGS